MYNRTGRRVLLWPDTFNNYLHPATAKAAVEVLESAGFQVVIPQRDLCCGRPLYDYGMLETAQRWLRQILESLGQEIAAGTPIVGLEACGERVLLPEVRKAAKDTLIVADGFSCREQILQTTDREALHVAQVLQMALQEGSRGAISNYPERDYVTPAPLPISRLATVAGGLALAVAAVAAIRFCRKVR